MASMRNWMLGAAVVAGAASLGSTTAQAAEFGFHMRGPVAYIPPCPGPGYVWVDGYMANGYWIPGYWNFAGVGGWDHEGRFEHGYDRGFGRGHDFHRDRGYDRFRS